MASSVATLAQHRLGLLGASSTSFKMHESTNWPGQISSVGGRGPYVDGIGVCGGVGFVDRFANL